MRVKVTRNYQITIPFEIRKELQINVGDYVEIILDKEIGGFIVKKITNERTTLTLGRKISPENIEKIIEEGMVKCID